MSENTQSSGETVTSEMDLEAQQAAVEGFLTDLLVAFGRPDATVTVEVGEDEALEASVEGSELGLLVGQKGVTLTAVQELVRSMVQRRFVGQPHARVRVDVAGYRARRKEALARFATTIAESVKESGVAKALDPMGSADRKVVHDTVNDIDGVVTVSEGEDAARRVVIRPGVSRGRCIDRRRRHDAHRVGRHRERSGTEPEPGVPRARLRARPGGPRPRVRGRSCRDGRSCAPSRARPGERGWRSRPGPGACLAGHRVRPPRRGARRGEFLESAVAELGLAARVRVVRARAESAGRDAALRARFDVVVARGFGAPAVTAECAAPFLEVGGRLLVSDPPVEGEGGSGPSGAGSSATAQAPERWPASGLDLVGLVVEQTWAVPYHYRSLLLTRPCPDRYPRRDGVPAKRPLF